MLEIANVIDKSFTPLSLENLFKGYGLFATNLCGRALGAGFGDQELHTIGIKENIKWPYVISRIALKPMETQVIS